MNHASACTLILSGVPACEYSHIPRHPTLPATANRPARPARTEERWTENQPTRRIVVVSSHMHRTWLRNPGFRRTVQLAPESRKVLSPSIAHSTVTGGTAEFGWDGRTTQDAKRMREANGHKSTRTNIHHTAGAAEDINVFAKSSSLLRPRNRGSRNLFRIFLVITEF
jgi:hypothetical protein